MEIAQITVTETDDDDKTFQSTLGLAIHLWSKGNDISLTLYKELVEQGYDVAQLQHYHSQR